MPDITNHITEVITMLSSIVKQSTQLATGLQNVSPKSDHGEGTLSVQYLFAIAAYLDECIKKSEVLFKQDETETTSSLHTLIDDMIKYDQKLREQYQMGNKFIFVHDRLKMLSMYAEMHSSASPTHKEKKEGFKKEDSEVFVYVYLFNAHGLHLATWMRMLSPTLFYDHSINRPIYQDKTQVEGFIARKPNRAQHGYLTVVVNKNDILPGTSDAPLKDMYGYPLIKVKEGTLHFDKCTSFTHQGHDYQLTNKGEMILQEKPK